MEPSGCSCSRVAPRPAVLASQWRRKGRDVSNDCVPVREDKYWGCCEFREKGANGVLHCGGEIERGAFFQKGRYRANVVSHVGQELAVVTKTAK